MSTAYPGNDGGERADDAQTIIKTGRKITGLTQEAMAAILGTDPRTLRRWESGEATTPDDIMLAVAKMANSPPLQGKVQNRRRDHAQRGVHGAVPGSHRPVIFPGRP